MTSPDISYLRRLIPLPPRHNPPHSTPPAPAYPWHTAGSHDNGSVSPTEVLEAPLDLGFPTGLSLHCTYTRDQVFAGLGHWTPEKINVHGRREGVLYLRDKNLDVFFITLNKSEKHFSPSTMYNDYAISERLFHWQSQSTTSASSPDRFEVR